jgi:nickel-type superoxide dismutase maturation protease
VGVAAAGALCARGFRRVRVTGDSMVPTFESGDRLLVGPTFGARVGHVVAVTDPRPGGLLMIKRVRWADRGWVDVRGDNEAASTDSRQLGLIPRANLAGRVIYRYAPPNRTGWLPGS